MRVCHCATDSDSVQLPKSTLSVWQRSSGLAGLAAVALIVAIVGISHRATRADELDWGLSNIEGALHKIESKLSASFSAPPPSVVPGVGFHLAKHTNAEYTGNHETWHWTSPTGMSTVADLMWFQHILMSNSWTSRCPSCDQTLLPRWKVWTWRFWKTFGRTGWGIVAWWEFFYMLWLVVMVVWWVRRNWWDGSTQSQTSGLTLLPHHVSRRLKYSFFYHLSKIFVDGQCKTFLPQDVSSKSHPSMATWPALKIELTRKIGKHVVSLFKTCGFRYQISQNI